MLDFLSVLNGEDRLLCYNGPSEFEAIMHQPWLGIDGVVLGERIVLGYGLQRVRPPLNLEVVLS